MQRHKGLRVLVALACAALLLAVGLGACSIGQGQRTRSAQGGGPADRLADLRLLRQTHRDL